MFCLLALLAENGRLNILGQVINSFNQIMTAHRGEVTCTVTTAKPLDKSMAKDLTTALQGFL